MIVKLIKFNLVGIKTDGLVDHSTKSTTSSFNPMYKPHPTTDSYKSNWFFVCIASSRNYQTQQFENIYPNATRI